MSGFEDSAILRAEGRATTAEPPRACFGATPAGVWPTGAGGGRRDGDRQGAPEQGAAAFGGFDADLAALARDDFSSDSAAEAGAAMAPRDRRVRLREALEDEGARVWGGAVPGRAR
ncbi:hypothetical protein [Rubrimonas cliftonensis]|uniref:hypothetical protein n=1 Tax=Rubrimonas cliftonensis TaxID=89524 RepID=UPI001587B14F|nr:hypothetical protein [Rubrimonas cliftonensis]